MKLTRASDYAIRLLVHLAKEGREGGRSGEIADELNIPFNHLAKLVQKLSRHRILISRKGKGGGIRLYANPRNIRLTDVVEAIEGPMVLSDCLFHKESCRFSRGCKFRKCLSVLRSKMYDFMSATTIYDLMPAGY